jgi:hypothetical protein
VAKWADEQHIRYRYDGSGGIWTTQAALDAAVGLHGALPAANEETRIEDLMQ